jgi:tetratricopeptide (TPR) repeat protein
LKKNRLLILAAYFMLFTPFVIGQYWSTSEKPYEAIEQGAVTPIGPASYYTIPLGNLSRGEAFYILVRSASDNPWSVCVNKIDDGKTREWLEYTNIPLPESLPEAVIGLKNKIIPMKQEDIKKFQDIYVLGEGKYELVLKTLGISSADLKAGVINVAFGDVHPAIEWEVSIRKEGKNRELMQNPSGYSPTFTDSVGYKSTEISKTEVVKTPEPIYDTSEALRLDPNKSIDPVQPNAYGDANILFDVGNNLREKGEFEEAKQAYIEALRVDPSNKFCWENLGDVFNDLYNFKGAMNAYIKVLTLDPNDKIVWNKLGYVLCMQGQYKKAIQAYNEALRIDPNYARAKYGIEDCLRYKATWGERG